MSLVVCDGAKQLLLTQLLSWLNANTRLRLFQNNHTPVHGDTAAAYTEASFPGYAFTALTSWGAVYLTADFHAFTDEVLRTFTATGSSPANTIYGYYITDLTGALLWAELAPAAVTINASGQTYSVLPRFSDTSEF
jgi:hypothetical protein